MNLKASECFSKFNYAIVPGSQSTALVEHEGLPGKIIN
jgi:hypothetical protein